MLQASWMPWWDSRHDGTQADVLEEIHQENLGGVPARGQWQLGFEVPGSLLDPPWKGQRGSVAQESSLVLDPEKWNFSALPVTGGAILDNFVV